MPKQKHTEEKPGVIYPSKNGNEYRLDGKIYVLNVKKCNFYEKEGDEYTVDCKIHQRGWDLYTYFKDADYIVKKYDGKRLYLTDNARKQIEESVEVIDAKIDEMLGASFRNVQIPDFGMSIHYRNISHGLYNFLISVVNSSGHEYIKIFENYRVRDFLHDLRFDHVQYLGNEDEEKKVTYLFESINDNPIYRSAVLYNDAVLQAIVKLYYNLADESECSYLSQILGVRVLPALPEQYNKEYYVDNKTIDYPMLDESGYKILHRPYFAMKGYTHSAWTLNPFSKCGNDAAPTGTEPITFDDYLELFEGTQS